MTASSFHSIIFQHRLIVLRRKKFKARPPLQQPNHISRTALIPNYVGRNLNNDVFNIDIYLWCLHSKHLTSTSDVSQNPQRVTVVTDNFITLSVRTRFTPIFYSLCPVNHQLIVTRLTRTWPTAGPKHPPRLLTSGYVKDACTLNPRASSTLTTLFIH